MAWFGEGLSSLKGQITNFTKEIVANNVVGLGSLNDTTDNEERSPSHDEDIEKPHLEKLKEHGLHPDKEIAQLRLDNERLRRLLAKYQSPRDRRVSEEATLECEEALSSSSHLPLVPLDEAGADSFLGQEQIPKDVKAEEEISSLRSRLRQTFQEKVLMEQSCSRLEKEVALLTQQVTEDRQQAQADVEARRKTEAVCKDCHRGTQTEVGSSGVVHHDMPAMAYENEQLKRERAQLRAELSRMSRAVQDLESQVAVSQDENANLSTGMEELDIQHQEAIQQIMVLKDSTQKRYENLLEEFEELKLKYEEMVKISEERELTEKHSSVSNITADLKSQILSELSEEIKNMITTEIPDKYFETSKKDASVLETVAAVEKMLSHTTARVDSSESKIRDLLKELRSKDDEVQEVEEENKVLRVKIEELKEHDDNLPTIAENNEDIEVMESKILSLENEISILREVRSNLEVEHTNYRSEIESLIRRLQAAEAMVRNQDNLQTEIGKYKETERELMRKLDDAEHTTEEMLTEIAQLKHTINKLEKSSFESNQNNSKIKELTGENSRLQSEVLKLKETELVAQKLSEDVQQVKARVVELENEKSHLLNELKKLKSVEEHSKNQSVELQDEQNIRSELEAEIANLKNRVILLEETEKNHYKLLEEYESESKLRKELEVSLDTMHAEMKRIEKEDEISKELLEKLRLESDMKLKELKALNTSLTQKLVKYEKESLDLSENADRLKLESESKARKLCEMILEKSIVEKELEKIRIEKCDLERKLDDVETQISKREEEYKITISKIQGHDILNTTDLNGALNELVNKCLLQEKEKVHLQNERLEMSEKIKELLSECDDKTECLARLSAQVKTLEAEKHSMEDTLRNLKETVSTGNQTEQVESPSVSEEMNRKLEELEEKNKELLAASDHVNERLLTVNTERQQLIETVQTKHAECLKYHAEIQRLCAELTKAEQQKVALSEEMQKKLEEKEEQLVTLQTSSDRQVAGLSEQIHTLQNQLDYVSQLLRVTDRQEAEGMPASDPPTTKIQSEKNEPEEKEAKRIEELYESLEQEQLRNKYLQDEVSEQHEKEESLMRELQRLRGHLVMVEENYTQETLRAEQQVQELSQRLSLAEERAKSSSTAYTSASIRANQQVESLSSQLRQVSEQKEKLSAQLAAAEDKLHKQAAALTNLQIVLEQFQRDKERDVAAETERLRQTIQQAHCKSEELANEIKTLQAQLKEAKEGLSAASRLTEQLDHKSNVISDLRQQVLELEEKLKKANERVQAASMSVEGKVDRCLVRNLVVGYVSAPPSSQPQALGIIATVLDFSPEDRQRSGLDPNTKLSGLKQQSLSEAFIRFLENESRPQPQLRLPLQEVGEGSRSRKTSVSEVGLTPARRISGSVLKDVLKQDI